MLKNRKALVIRTLLRSKNYIVVTDQDATMMLDVRNPRDLTSQMLLGQYRASLALFRENLDEIIGEYDKRLDKFATSGKSRKTATKRRK